MTGLTGSHGSLSQAPEELEKIRTAIERFYICNIDSLKKYNAEEVFQLYPEAGKYYPSNSVDPAKRFLKLDLFLKP
jgi:hypothetical protein